MPEEATKKTLYIHVPHNHKPRNVNTLHQEQQSSSVNQRLAMWLTAKVNTMPTAYIFAALAVIGLFGLLNLLPPFVFLLATWISQQFLQLVFLPVLGVGQAVLGKHQELQADEAFNTTMKTYNDIEQIMLHLNKQDEKILEIDERILKVLERLEARGSNGKKQTQEAK